MVFVILVWNGLALFVMEASEYDRQAAKNAKNIILAPGSIG